MNTPTRDADSWDRSASRHTRDSEPVQALLSGHLAHLARESRDDFDATEALARARHAAALFDEAKRIIREVLS